MGLLSAGSTLTRLKVINSVSAEILRGVPDALAKNCFKDIDQTTDERSYGWVCFDNFLDSAWKTAPPEKAEFLAFALRLDTRRIAPAIFRKHFMIAMEKEQAEKDGENRKYISKNRKYEIREQVKFRLMSKTLPVPAVFDVSWNIHDNIIYFGSIRDKIVDMFMDHFKKSFGLDLERLTPYCLARGFVNPGLLHKLESAESVDFGK